MHRLKCPNTNEIVRPSFIIWFAYMIWCHNYAFVFLCSLSVFFLYVFYTKLSDQNHGTMHNSTLAGMKQHLFPFCVCLVFFLLCGVFGVFFLRIVFVVFQGWECEFRHSLSPLIWSSDCRLINCKTRLGCHCTLHVEEESSLCVDPCSCSAEKRLHPCCKKLPGFFWTLNGVDQKQHNARDLKVRWSTWLDSGGEHRHVISQPVHFQGDSICDCVVIVNLHPWGLMKKVITELHGQKSGGKGVCQGPEQVCKHRISLWLSHSPISDFWRSLSR